MGRAMRCRSVNLSKTGMGPSATGLGKHVCAPCFTLCSDLHALQACGQMVRRLFTRLREAALAEAAGQEPGLCKHGPKVGR